MIPAKLKSGSHLRIVSPSRSMGIINSSVRKVALDRLEALGFRVSFSKHCELQDRFDSSPVQERVEDLHAAFLDPDVDGILTTIGGYNSVEILESLDFDLIAANPKCFCGYSDITVLGNAIFSQTGLVNY